LSPIFWNFFQLKSCGNVLACKEKGCSDQARGVYLVLYNLVSCSKSTFSFSYCFQLFWFCLVLYFHVMLAELGLW